MAYVAKPLTERFEKNVSKVEATGCWNWSGYVNADGYGSVGVQRRVLLAHRVSYELFCGEIPDKMFVLHRCDNRACVNPEHLFVGTHVDNMKDMVSKGRQMSGSGHVRPLAKLTEQEVIAIKSARGVSQRELGLKYGVGQDQISRIRSGKRWSYL